MYNYVYYVKGVIFMLKKFKKLIIFFAIPILVFVGMGIVTQTSVHANVKEDGPCPIHGIHNMVANGTVCVYDKSTKKLIFTGGLYRCSYCGDYCVMQGHPENGGTIGYFDDGVTVSSSYAGVSAVYVDKSSLTYVSGTVIHGFRFN